MKKKLDQAQIKVLLHISISIAMLVFSGFLIFGVNSLFEADFFSLKWFVIAFSTFLSLAMIMIGFVAGFINIFSQTKGRPNLSELIAQKLKKPIQ